MFCSGCTNEVLLLLTLPFLLEQSSTFIILGEGEGTVQDVVTLKNYSFACTALYVVIFECLDTCLLFASPSRPKLVSEKTWRASWRKGRKIKIIGL